MKTIYGATYKEPKRWTCEGHRKDTGDLIVGDAEKAVAGNFRNYEDKVYRVPKLGISSRTDKINLLAVFDNFKTRWVRVPRIAAVALNESPLF